MTMRVALVGHPEAQADSTELNRRIEELAASQSWSLSVDQWSWFMVPSEAHEYGAVLLVLPTSLKSSDLAHSVQAGFHALRNHSVRGEQAML